MARPPDNLLLFTPHVPLRPTTGGWTPDRQKAFIAALARTGVVTAAARSVGMSPRSAYQLRERVRRQVHNLADTPMTPEQAAAAGPGYTYSFAAAWDLALDAGLRLQIESALPHALEGERVPIIRRGAILGWHTRFNFRLALAALGAHRRMAEGSSYDHELRIAERTALSADRIETLLRLGPIPWPDPPAPETREERLARRREARHERRTYGPRSHGLLDPYGPADRPPRTLAERAAAPPQRPPAPAEPRVALL